MVQDPLFSQPTHSDGSFYKSPPMQIGKHHEWRVIVIPFWLKPNERCTKYQWRLTGTDMWNDADTWPTYKSDNTFSGLPKGLKKLYDREFSAIQAALNPK